MKFARSLTRSKSIATSRRTEQHEQANNDHRKTTEPKNERNLGQSQADNPFEIFEPHPSEENYSGFEELADLYESRLRRLCVEQILNGDDEELKHAFFKMLEGQIRRDSYQ